MPQRRNGTFEVTISDGRTITPILIILQTISTQEKLNQDLTTRFDEYMQELSHLKLLNIEKPVIDNAEVEVGLIILPSL